MSAFADFCLETSTTEGTSDYALEGAATGYRGFVSAIGAGNSGFYVASDGTDREVGYGAVSASPDMLSRDTILYSTNSNNKVNWGSGTKRIYSASIADVLNALVSNALGATRPAWIQQGGTWIDQVDTDQWDWYLYDGATDILIGRFDADNDSFTPAVDGTLLSALATQDPSAMTVALNMAKGSDIASATTTDIGAATGNFVHITGTTTITGLGTIQAGTWRFVIFDGALTLTHNATSLILPGEANITTEAGDAAVFVSEGSGNWRCLSYFRKSTLYERVGRYHGVVSNAGNANVAASDAGKLVRQTSGSANTLTIQTDANGSYTGTIWLDVQQAGAGTVTIEAAAGVDLNGVTAGSVDLPDQYSMARLVRIGTDEWTAEVLGGGGAFEQALLHVRDEKTAGTHGGDFDQGDWRTRDLNTVATNEISGASLSSNQITLPAGTYYVEARAPASGADRHKARLRNVSDSSDTLIGSSAYCESTGSQTDSLIRGRFTIAASKTFELQHRCQENDITDGFGIATDAGVVEVYAEALIWKVA